MSIEELYKNGYTIIPNLIGHETCDNLKNYLDQRFNHELPYNYHPGHYQIHLPKNYDNIPEEIVLNSKNIYFYKMYLIKIIIYILILVMPMMQ